MRDWPEMESTRTMKKNMVPLLGIAFVVAIISTGVFYGLFAGKLRSSSDLPGHGIVVAARDLDRGTVLQPSDLRVSEVQGMLAGGFSRPDQAAGATLLTAVKANEPVLEERVSMPVAGSAGQAGPVPSGMRAVTVHVSQSESLLNLLHSGSRVDLQAVADRNGSPELRTVLENVPVLAVNAADANNGRNGSMITVLVHASEADTVALADAASRIRIALRNPLDEETTPQKSLPLSAVFSEGAPRDQRERESVRGTAAAVWDHPLQLRIQVLSVSDQALDELRGQATPVGSDRAWRVTAFDSGSDAEKVIRKLEQSHQIEVISSERLTAGIGRPISYRAGAGDYKLRVRFSPEWISDGKLVLRIKPEAGTPDASGIATINYDVGVSETTGFLLQAFLNDSPGENSAARLFPGRIWKNNHLVVFVATRSLAQTAAVAVARGSRGR